MASLAETLKSQRLVRNQARNEYASVCRVLTLFRDFWEKRPPIFWAFNAQLTVFRSLETQGIGSISHTSSLLGRGILWKPKREDGEICIVLSSEGGTNATRFILLQQSNMGLL